MTSGVFMEASLERKEKETKLEIEVQQCSSMILYLKELSSSLSERLLKGNTKINIGEIYPISEEDVICESTGKPCPLYDRGKYLHSPNNIDYHRLDWCPSSEDSVVKYNLKYIKRGAMLDSIEIERIEE
jgi:hypothetical protein